jgi:hypothetical protein
MNELEYWTGVLNERAAELGLEKTVRPVQPGEGEGYAIHWVYESGDTLVELGWSVEEAERALHMVAMQMQQMG